MSRYTSPASLAWDYGEDEARIISWIEKGDLRADWVESVTVPGRFWWRIHISELPVFHALREGKTREEGEAERDAIFAHIGKRTLHTPTGTPVSDEELEIRRLREANG